LVAADARTPLVIRLSPGNAHDGHYGQQLITELADIPATHLTMDRAYEGDETRALVLKQNITPVVPPKSNRKEPWKYDKEIYKKRNEVERFFCRLKRFRRIATRYDKLDILFLFYINLVCFLDLFSVNRL
jgi:transposase